MSKLKEKHLQSEKRVLQLSKGPLSLDFNILYQRSVGFMLEKYVDSNCV